MSKNQSSPVKNSTLTSEDLKTDSIPDTSRERDDDDEENNESLSYPKEEIAGEERETGCDINETYLRPQSHVSHGTKKKPSPKSIPKSSKNKKEKKQPSGIVFI
jgi:hypothetical protein